MEHLQTLHAKLIQTWQQNREDDGTDFNRCIVLGEALDKATDAYCVAYLETLS